MKHIRLYLFVLFTACSMFMVCPFAFADSIPYPDPNISSLDDFYYSYFPSGYDTYFNTYKSQFDYYQCLRYYNTSTLKNCYIINFLPCEYVSTNIYSSSSQIKTPIASYRYTKDAIISINSDSNNNALNKTFVSFCYCEASSANRMQITSFVPTQFSSSGNGFISVNGNYTYIGGNYNDGVNFNYNQFYGYISNCYSYYTLSNNKFVLSEPNTIIYSEDERLKLYKLWSSQYGDSLVVDLSAFRSYTPAAAYEFSNVVLTLTCNGVDTDLNLPLSSSTINNGWDNNNNLYTISTPVSDFTLSDTYDTYITKVSFSLDVSSPGGSGSTLFYISTNFPIDVHHSSITPVAVPTPVYTNPTVKSDNDLTQIVYYLNNTGINYSGEFLMMQGLPNIPVWANRYTETIFKMSNDSVQDAGEFITEPVYSALTGWSYDTVNIFDYFNSIIGNYDNVYDVFVFPVDYYRSYNEQLSVLYEDLGVQGYIVFFTNRYYNHQNSFNTTDILSVIQKDANNFVDFVEYMQIRLDDFETKSLEILNPIYDETTYIDDKLASILYAVNSIENYNDSSIVSLLIDIKNLLSSPENEIDTPQECIQLYEAHPNYFNELWGTPTPALRSASVTPSANNPYISSDYVRADLVPAWWEGKTLTMIYILKNDGETSRFYNDILNGLFDSYENLIESDNSFNTYIDSLFKTGYDYSSSFYGHLFDLDYNPEAWDGGFASNE